MQFSFRLAELIGHDPDPRKRPGTIKAICEYTGLDRHQVSALLKNEVKYIPLDALSRLCDYLVNKGYLSADQLPGALFAVQPEHFWELLGRRKRVDLCVGVRHDEGKSWGERAWVVASDSVLLGQLLNDVSTLGGSAKFRRDEESSELLQEMGPAKLENLTQSLVWSPPEDEPLTQNEIQRATDVYEDFSDWSGDKGLICIGSTKSNPVVELTMSRAFGCEPFVSQDHCKKPTERACPIYVRYRDTDPKPESSCGGMQLSADVPSNEPGIYFENAKGKWECCPWTSPGKDAALVFYIHRESQGRLEMILGGFSGRSTRMLAKTLTAHSEEFWPPVFELQGMQIGAFIVQYEFPRDQHTSQDILRTDLVATTKILKLDGAVIERRLGAAVDK